jgi:hypothetical protein
MQRRIAAATSAYKRVTDAVLASTRLSLSVTGPAGDDAHALANAAIGRFAQRDRAGDAGGYRDAMPTLSHEGSGHAVLAIALAVRGAGTLPPIRDVADVSSAVDAVLPIDPDAVAEERLAWIPDDDRRAFDDAMLRRAFPEIREL